MASENKAIVIMQASRCRIVNSMQLKCIAVQSRGMHYGCLLSAVKRTLRKRTLSGLVPLTRREVSRCWPLVQFERLRV